MVGRSRICVGFALGIVLLLLLTGGALAKPGQVDVRYGFGGTLDITDALPGSEFGRNTLAEAVGPENESVVLSADVRACPGAALCADLYVTRVLADGTPDAGFAAKAGIVSSVAWGTAPGQATDAVHGAIAVQPDGKVVIASGDGVSVRIARLNRDGSHDETFHTPGDADRPPGQVVVFLGGETSVSGLEVGPRSGLTVTGSSGPPGSSILFLSRVHEEGQHDEQFGVAGTVFSGVQLGGLPADIALRGEATLIGGPICCAAPPTMTVAEFDAHGNLSKVRSVKLPKRLEAGRPKGVSTVIPGPKGSTFVVGSAANGTFVAKYMRDGHPEADFAKGGFALVRGMKSESPSAVLDSRGRIVLVGRRLDVPDTAGLRAGFVATVRLLPSGRFDQTYGGARPLLVVEEGGQRSGLDFNRVFGLAQRSDGLLIMLGETLPNPYARTIPVGANFGLVRFLGGGHLK